jgi:hypothetical protein
MSVGKAYKAKLPTVNLLTATGVIGKLKQPQTVWQIWITRSDNFIGA